MREHLQNLVVDEFEMTITIISRCVRNTPSIVKRGIVRLSVVGFISSS